MSAVHGVAVGEEAEILACCSQSVATMLGVSQAQVASDGRQGDRQPTDDRSSQLHLATKVSVTVMPSLYRLVM